MHIISKRLGTLNEQLATRCILNDPKKKASLPAFELDGYIGTNRFQGINNTDGVCL